MRYRPFGTSGAAVSNLTLCLGADATARGAAHVRQMIFAGLEAGINAYHFDSVDPALLQAAGEALGHVERRLVIASVNLGVFIYFSPIRVVRV
ncbi:oxidoreductase, partial [Brevundimonas naejangsanensis]